MKKVSMILFLLMVVVGLSLSANAALIVRGTDSLGNQLIYDDYLNITWYDYSAYGRRMDLVNWAANLSVKYGYTTFSDWRLPIVINPSNPGGMVDANRSEMGYLYFFGTHNGYMDIYDYGPFNNIPLNQWFWLGTDIPSLPAPEGQAYAYMFTRGYLIDNNYALDTSIPGNGFDEGYGIAVRDGDVTTSQPPVAQCQDVTAFAGSNCTASASIDNGSYDPDGDPITLTQSPPGPYSKGNTLVTLTVTDAASSQCTGTVTVVDNSPPTINNLSVSPSMLWPANHRMVNVTVNYNATDNCGQPTCQISGVTSNEPISNSAYTIMDARHVALRVERLGSGTGP